MSAEGDRKRKRLSGEIKKEKTEVDNATQSRTIRDVALLSTMVIVHDWCADDMFRYYVLPRACITQVDYEAFRILAHVYKNNYRHLVCESKREDIWAYPIIEERFGTFFRSPPGEKYTSSFRKRWGKDYESPESWEKWRVEEGEWGVRRNIAALFYLHLFYEPS